MSPPLTILKAGLILPRHLDTPDQSTQENPATQQAKGKAPMVDPKAMKMLQPIMQMRRQRRQPLKQLRLRPTKKAQMIRPGMQLMEITKMTKEKKMISVDLFRIITLTAAYVLW